MEADGRPVIGRWFGREELVHRVEQQRELSFVVCRSLFQVVHAMGKLAVPRDELSQSHECTNDGDTHSHRARATQHGRKHGHAVLRKRGGRVLNIAPTAGRRVQDRILGMGKEILLKVSVGGSVFPSKRGS